MHAEALPKNLTIKILSNYNFKAYSVKTHQQCGTSLFVNPEFPIQTELGDS